MVTINIGRKEMVFFSVVILVFVVAGFGVAYGDFLGNEAEINGHSSDEIMVNNSAGELVSLQSVIDAGGFEKNLTFEDYIETDTDGNILIDGTTYLAESDGLLTSTMGGRSSMVYVDKIKANVDGETFDYLRVAGTAGGFISGWYGGATVPVAQGEYVRVGASDSTGGKKIGWMSFVSGGLVAQ